MHWRQRWRGELANGKIKEITHFGSKRAIIVVIRVSVVCFKRQDASQVLVVQMEEK